VSFVAENNLIMLLAVHDLHVYYGQIHAVKGISLCVQHGEIVAVLGANGAGKSTMLMTIAGAISAQSGQITFDGRDLTRARMDQIARCGINIVPEGRRIFPDFTVDENLQAGAYGINDARQRTALRERVYALFPRLRERLRQLAGTLSGGEQQMLAIARGLMAAPKVLLLDEPALGLAPMLVEDIFAHIQEIHQQGTAILLVEQNAQLALDLASRGYVLETGRVVVQGTTAELRQNDLVRQAYLGI
jgi:branched-chain amino acid transport system ATP-binding protein